MRSACPISADPAYRLAAREQPSHAPAGALSGRIAAPAWQHGPITSDQHNGGSNHPPEPEAEDEEPGGFARWRRESALGEVGTGIAKGLRSIFAPSQEEVVIMASVPGDPPDADQRLRVILDPDDPTKSVAILPTPAEPAPGAGTPSDQD